MNNLCGLINVIDTITSVNVNNSILFIGNNETIKECCTTNDTGKKEECDSYIKITNSAIIAVLNYFKNISVADGDDLEDDKIAEYAILWLNHKLNQYPEYGVSNLDDFHNTYIKDIKETTDIEGYNAYMDFIEKKQDMMNMDIKDMSKFYASLKSLCDMQTKIDANKSNCASYLEDSQKFVDEYEKLNENYDTKGVSYKKILSTLFNDYDRLRKKCNNFQSFPSMKITQSYVQDSDVTSSSSSIGRKLIPVFLAFAISVFLGIAYKYSLFGFDKRLQRKQLREKIKK
ncbi:CIR protein [Plasmodium chabaudi chabaudi]|uniref:CIR protein n=1 Tax=Plasmodium chabaudi chabaudi TaxID=31271 RepID=A0A4V0KC64_PLACU|nr:CIR protein [Plasmodium chabaudi chabaudi]VTZ70681.1 CIR protein [Plasmodium chabaudi chabaudi]|eukprot:XP_016654789.1 CIR protein [Plasmodium chabaudi chabaudi]